MAQTSNDGTEKLNSTDLFGLLLAYTELSLSSGKNKVLPYWENRKLFIYVSTESQKTISVNCSESESVES